MVKLSKNKYQTDKFYSNDKFTPEASRDIINFHKKLDEYGQTPLKELKICEGTRVFVKDESYRFGLNAFKALGGSYAIGKILDENKNISTVITATDGNHGRGVAWSAKKFGLKSVVYMPKGTAKERLDNILSLGADAKILDIGYDDAVRKAEADADASGWTLVQDTSWDGYEKIPELIMQGYTTMGSEILSQLGDTVPTHIFLQAGVGSMAGAMSAFFTSAYKDSKPIITIVESVNANCIYMTNEAFDGKLHAYKGDMNTIMAGLACGEVCTVAWDILKNCADYFACIDDDTVKKAMRYLNENGIISGESGAAGFAAFLEIMTDEKNAYLKNEMKLNKDSVVLCISTEGATDRENYDKIINEKDV